MSYRPTYSPEPLYKPYRDHDDDDVYLNAGVPPPKCVVFVFRPLCKQFICMCSIEAQAQSEYDERTTKEIRGRKGAGDGVSVVSAVAPSSLASSSSSALF